MPRTFLRQRQPNARERRRRVFLSLLALALLTMPVSYRGGTDVTHAHSFFQFLSDAATGSLDHHRRWADANTAGHHGHDYPAPTPVVAPAPPGVPLLEGLAPPHERATAIGLALLSLSVAIAGGRAEFFASAGRLVGRAIRPPVPPPRPIGLLA